MRPRLKLLCTTLVATAVAASCSTAMAGLKDDGGNACQPNPVPTQSCVSSAEVSFDGPNTTFQVVHATGKVKGKIQIRFAQPNGATKAQMASVTKCWKAGPVTRNARPGERCGMVKIGTWYINSGFCIHAQKWCKFWDQVKSGDEFDMVGDQMHKKDCWNKVWFSNSVFPEHMGHIYMPSQVDVRAHFSVSITLKATSTSNAHAVSFAAAVCSVTANGVTASAAGMAYGEGKGTATGYAYATASTMVQAKADARNASLANLEIDKLSATGTASSQSRTEAWSSARVNVSCSVSPTPPAPSGPPPTCTTDCGGTPPCSGSACSPPPPCTGSGCNQTCPSGTHGTYPNCQPNVCPAGTTGTYPNCIPNQTLSCTLSINNPKESNGVETVQITMNVTGNPSSELIHDTKGNSSGGRSATFNYTQGDSPYGVTISGKLDGTDYCSTSITIDEYNGGPGGAGG